MANIPKPSPSRAGNAAAAAANWPPKSPYEALLSSPSGRKRWESNRSRFSDRETSPSPRGKSVTTSRALRELQDMPDDDDDDDDDANEEKSNDQDDDEDDEETLQLKLQAIEAKLKLKKLQNKTKKLSNSQSSSAATCSPSPRKRPRTSSLLPGVQIPVSPIKERIALPDPQKQQAQTTSPARVLLGIDKGLKAKDVSLKRARSGETPSRPTPAESTPKPKQTFSERIAATRLSNEEQEAKQNRIQNSRSKAFSQIDSPFVSKTRSTPASSLPRSTPASSLHPSERYSVIDGDSEGKSTDLAQDGSSFESFSSLHLSRRSIPHTDLVRHLDGKELYTLPRLLRDVKSPHYDPPDCESDFVVLAIIASKSSPYTSKAKHHTNSSTGSDPHQDINPSNKFMVLTLTDLKWELDLFLFDTAFTRFWKLTPGTVVAILNPSIMPPKSNQHNGRFSLKLASSEDTLLEIGNARDLGFCKSIKKDGKECDTWVNKRKTQFCDYHVELAIEKTRKSRMEVNGMYRPTKPGANQAFKPNSRTVHNFGAKSSNLKRDYESGAQFYMGGKSGFSAATLLDSEDIGRAEAMRRRLRDREKERVLGEKLGRLGNGMGAEYLQASTAAAVPASSSSKVAPTLPLSSGAGPATAAAPNLTTIARPDEYDHGLDPQALGLLSKKASEVDLGPVRGRKRAFNFSASSSSATTTTTGGGTEAMGWGGANRRFLFDANSNTARAPPTPLSPEKGQTRLNTTTAAAAAAAAAATTQFRDIRPGGLARKDREESPRKRARFEIEGKGLREPGRDSLGDATTTNTTRMTAMMTNKTRGGAVVGASSVVGAGGVRRDKKGRVIIERAPESSDDDLDIV